jgi:hypothetical protein
MTEYGQFRLAITCSSTQSRDSYCSHDTTSPLRGLVLLVTNGAQI